MLIAIAMPPRDGPVQDMENGILRHVENIGEALVLGIAFRVGLHEIAQQTQRVVVFGFLQADGSAGIKVLTEHIGGERDRAAGMLLFAHSEQIRREADLRFHLFFAIAVVVVGQNSDHHAALIAAGDLESRSTVIEILFFLPTHPIAALALGGNAHMRQSDVFLLHAYQMWRQDDAARVPGPVHGVECSVVFWKIGIARIAENAFDEIEIADQAARCDEADLHGLFRIASGRGRHQRTEQQRHEAAHAVFLVGGERQHQHALRRMQRHRPQSRESLLGNRGLIRRNGQPALGDVEQTLRRALVALGIVEHPLLHPVGLQTGR